MHEAKEITQVAEQVNRMEEELKRLGEQIDKLRSRLAPVLKERQLEMGQDKEEEEVVVPLANDLRENVQRTAICVSSIAEIINLLEV